VVFKKNAKKFFLSILRLQAAIALQWLQSDGNSLPK